MLFLNVFPASGGYSLESFKVIPLFSYQGWLLLFILFPQQLVYITMVIFSCQVLFTNFSNFIVISRYRPPKSGIKRASPLQSPHSGWRGLHTLTCRVQIASLNFLSHLLTPESYYLCFCARSSLRVVRNLIQFILHQRVCDD